MSLLNSTGMGKAPTGSSVAQPDRPMTGSRGAAAGGPPGTASGRPPGTAMRGAAGQPPGTAYKRLGTAQGRPGTGQQGAAGVRTGTAVQVENRPITNHGMVGMKFQAAGAGRKVLDKNYFLNELRQKRMEIANITQQMKVRGQQGGTHERVCGTRAGREEPPATRKQHLLAQRLRAAGFAGRGSAWGRRCQRLFAAWQVPRHAAWRARAGRRPRQHTP